VVIETFTFLDCNANRDVGLTWKEAVYKPGTVRILPCELRDLKQCSEYFRCPDLRKQSARHQLCDHEARAKFGSHMRSIITLPSSGSGW
jgi:hypothetical protein